MRILAFTDIHADKRALQELGKRASKADIVLCAGDISVFGMDLLDTLEIMNGWNKPLFFIHGNHEDDSIFKDVNKHYPNLHFVHAKEKQHENLAILGWGGGGFASEDHELAKFAKSIKPRPNRIMLFHGPPYGTTTDWMDSWDEYRGNKTYRTVIEELQPFLVVVGHLHENFGKHDKIGRSLVINPGPLGKLIEIGEKAEKELKEAAKGTKKTKKKK